MAHIIPTYGIMPDAARGARGLAADASREAGQGSRSEGAPPMAHSVSGSAAGRSDSGGVRRPRLMDQLRIYAVFSVQDLVGLLFTLRNRMCLLNECNA